MEAPERQQLAAWVLAANKAWGMKSTSPLPIHLERQLSRAASTDEAKVKACAQKLGVLHRLGTQTSPTAATGQRRPYSFERDGRLERGARVWHKLHGSGRVVFMGQYQNHEVIEVAFDKGRTTKFLRERAGLEILT